MDWQSLSREECIEKLGTDAKHGLTQQQVKQRLQRYGKNELKQQKKKGLLVRFLSQFSDFMVIILLLAAAVSFVTSYVQKDADYIDSIIILFIVVVNAIVGMIQESRAEKAIEALKKLSSPESQVIRDGRRVSIDSTELVPGDIVLLETGDLVPADIRLLESNGLKVEESSLTGESVPAEKEAAAVYESDTPIGDRKNMLFSSGCIVSGRGAGVVTETAMSTQVGRIAHMISMEESPQTPLQRKLARTGKILGLGAIFICILIFIMGLFQNIAPLEMFMISISLAVAAIPEGLPAVVTIVLAMGVRRMANNRAIVRRLPAVETLGGASVICSDKTGTLTQNKMTVVELAGDEGTFLRGSAEGDQLLKLGTLCSNCEISGGKVHGDPTEAAILTACPVHKSELERQWPRIKEIPFSSSRKMMTTVHRMAGGRYRIITKGAPDLLLGNCSFVRSHGEEIPLNSSGRRTLLRKNEEMASRALRVLGVAYRDTINLPAEKDLEKDLVFCGFIGMIDPPRPQVAKAVQQCIQAGIRPVMITGDHAATAAAIGSQLGIMKKGDEVITGSQLNAMEQRDLERNIYRYPIFARVSPEHKVRIVRAFQKHGEVVAMTGDGVNDAPALRAADIGCAMGGSGTDVAKAAADMVLTDDNFATIVSAVREGRGIYENIKKTIHFLISCNIGEILTIFGAFLLQIPTPLLAIQLLWVNLVTDSLPALALGVDPVDDDVMKHKPKRQEESVFSGGMGYNILIEGCLIGALSLFAYTIGRIFFDSNSADPIIGRTMAFAALSFSQIVHAFNMHSEHSVFHSGIFKNSRLWLAAFICVCLQAAVIVVEPISRIFKTAVLSGGQWLWVVGISLIPLLVVELEKKFFRAPISKKKVSEPVVQNVRVIKREKTISATPYSHQRKLDKNRKRKRKKSKIFPKINFYLKKKD